MLFVVSRWSIVSSVDAQVFIFFKDFHADHLPLSFFRNLFLSRISTLAQEIADGIGATEDATSKVNETVYAAVLNLCYSSSSSGCGQSHTIHRTTPLLSTLGECLRDQPRKKVEP